MRVRGNSPRVRIAPRHFLNLLNLLSVEDRYENFTLRC